MLKSQAPSRQKQMKGRLALASTKRQKTATRPLGRSSTQISAENGTGPLPPRTDAPTIVRGRWPTPMPVKVSVDGREDSSSHHQPQQQQTSRELQDHHQCFENKKKNASSPTPDPSNFATDKHVKHTRAAMNCVSAAAADDIAASPARRVKARGQKRAAATVTTEASGNGDVEWRVPPLSSNLPYRDTGASSGGSRRSSRRDRSKAQAGPPTAKRLPAECSSSRSTSSRAPRSSNDSGSSKARSSCSTSRTGRATSPLKKHSSSSATTAAATKEEEKDDEAGRKDQEQEEEEEGELPPCPYPGHKNVSWTCQGCGGARHHLTSRSAMEPLQRIHGFKVCQGWISETSRCLDACFSRAW